MNETIGQQLRQAREAQKLTLEQIAGATRMRERYLRALEEDNYEALPSLAQARGFLRAYASYLKLDPEVLLQDWNGKQPQAPIIEKSPRSTTRPAETQPISYSEADQIFVDVGSRLSIQRELLGLSLDDVVRYTHLRRHYLQALEDGQLDDLPSPTQGRGMLENYAVFLGMDPEPLLLRFAEGLQARLNVRQVARNEPSTRPAPRRRPMPALLRRLLSPDILIGATFATFLVIFVVWGAIRIFSMNTTQTPEPAAPSIAEFLLATATPNPTLNAVEETLPPALTQAVILPDVSGADATAQIVLPTGAGSGVQVYVTVLQRAFLRATVDGKVEFEGRVIPGSAYPFVGESQVEILTSNGAGLQIFYNQASQGQQDLGVLGTFGQVVNRIFTPQGVLIPTATVTRTPAPTPRTTPTAAPANAPGVGPALP